MICCFGLFNRLESVALPVGIIDLLDFNSNLEGDLPVDICGFMNFNSKKLGFTSVGI